MIRTTSIAENEEIMQRHRSFCGFVFAVSFLGLTAWAGVLNAANADKQPNIVLIVADDLGWRDLRCQGSTYYQTPNIDRLASQGLRLMSYYGCHVGAPSYAAYLTGQYPPRTGIYADGAMEEGTPAIPRVLTCPKNQTKLPLDKITLAQVLRNAGYVTAMFGQWPIGDDGDFHPAKRGFDRAVVTQGSYFSFTTNPEVEIPQGVYLTDFLTDLSLEFIGQNQSKPFFLYLPHQAVHKPLEGKPIFIEQYFNAQPDGGQTNRIYGAMISGLDQSVGRIMAKLDQLELSENTIVILTSSDGGVGGYTPNVPYMFRKYDVTDNFPLRSGYGTLYEGGIRVPFIVRWPANVPENAISETPAINVDLFPTLLELAGAKLPDQPLDGVSLASVFRSPATELDRKSLYWHFPGYLQGNGIDTRPQGVIRKGDYKLLEFFEDDHIELYNVKKDLSEATNLAHSMPDKKQELLDALRTWRSDLHAPMPKPMKKEQK
jgi:arylsulfatase A-like enzyme